MDKRRLRSHGMERDSCGLQFHEIGFNYRLTDFQAALGRAQLPHLQGWIDTRRALAHAYRIALAPLQHQGLLVLPAADSGHSWQTLMVVLADGIDRSTVISRLADAGIEANLGAQCLSAQPAFRAFARTPDEAPNALRLYRQGLALPFCERYGSAEVTRVAAALTTALQDSHA